MIERLESPGDLGTPSPAGASFPCQLATRRSKHVSNTEVVEGRRGQIGRFPLVFRLDGSNKFRSHEPFCEATNEPNRLIQRIREFRRAGGRSALIESTRDLARDLERNGFLLGGTDLPLAHLPTGKGQVLRGKSHLSAQ
jgi:hypothetical protein